MRTLFQTNIKTNIIFDIEKILRFIFPLFITFQVKATFGIQAAGPVELRRVDLTPLYVPLVQVAKAWCETPLFDTTITTHTKAVILSPLRVHLGLNNNK